MFITTFAELQKIKSSQIVAVRLAHAKRSATAGGPRYAIAGRPRNRENVHSVIKGLNENFELAISIEVIDRRCGRSAVAIAIVAGIGKSDVMQKAAVGAQYHQVPGVCHIRVSVSGEDDLRGAVLVEIGDGGLRCIHHGFSMHKVEPPDLHRIGSVCMDKTVVQRDNDLGTAVALDIDRGRRRDAVWRIPTGNRYGGTPSGQGFPTSFAHGRPASIAVGALQNHDGISLGLIRHILFNVGNADHLVSTVAVQVDDVRRRCGPLQPFLNAGMRPIADVQMVVIFLHPGIGPADELPPGQAVVQVLARAIGEPRGGIDGDTVEVEGLDVMVVVGDDNFQVVVVVDIADRHVESIAAET